MANNTTNTLTATITAQEDTTQNIPINRTLANLNFDSVYAEFMYYILVPASGLYTIIIPPNPGVISQLYIRNIDPSNPVTLNLTPHGGSAPAGGAQPFLYPGDAALFWSKPGSANGGYGNAVINNASAQAVLIELFIGG